MLVVDSEKGACVLCLARIPSSPRGERGLPTGLAVGSCSLCKPTQVASPHLLLLRLLWAGFEWEEPMVLCSPGSSCSTLLNKDLEKQPLKNFAVVD